jgi:hypothetical protein
MNSKFCNKLVKLLKMIVFIIITNSLLLPHWTQLEVGNLIRLNFAD